MKTKPSPQSAQVATTIELEQTLHEHAAEIRKLGKNVRADMNEIGRRLKECRRIQKEDNNWWAWLKDELSMSPQTAGRLIQIHELAGKHSNLECLDIPVSGLYMLAAPSTPAEAVETIIEQAKAGAKVTVDGVKAAIKSAKSDEKGEGAQSGKSRSRRSKVKPDPAPTMPSKCPPAGDTFPPGAPPQPDTTPTEPPPPEVEGELMWVIDRSCGKHQNYQAAGYQVRAAYDIRYKFVGYSVFCGREEIAHGIATAKDAKSIALAHYRQQMKAKQPESPPESTIVQAADTKPDEALTAQAEATTTTEPEKPIETTTISKPAETSTNTPKAPICRRRSKPPQVKTLASWCESIDRWAEALSISLDQAGKQLTDAERGALFQHLKQAVQGLMRAAQGALIDGEANEQRKPAEAADQPPAEVAGETALKVAP